MALDCFASLAMTGLSPYSAPFANCGKYFFSVGPSARHDLQPSTKYGLETMCIGGGQGIAAVFERAA